jgi:hypothetical protein
VLEAINLDYRSDGGRGMASVSCLLGGFEIVARDLLELYW